jgi:hypothetical protein
MNELRAGRTVIFGTIPSNESHEFFRRFRTALPSVKRFVVRSHPDKPGEDKASRLLMIPGKNIRFIKLELRM